MGSKDKKHKDRKGGSESHLLRHKGSNGNDWWQINISTFFGCAQNDNGLNRPFGKLRILNLPVGRGSRIFRITCAAELHVVVPPSALRLSSGQA